MQFGISSKPGKVVPKINRKGWVSLEFPIEFQHDGSHDVKWIKVIAANDRGSGKKYTSDASVTFTPEASSIVNEGDRSPFKLEPPNPVTRARDAPQHRRKGR